MTYEIKHYDGINYTPAIQLIVEAQADLLRTGKSEPLLSALWDNQVVAAFEGDYCIGVITWNYSAWVKTASINIGYVDKNYRRKGIYRMLWDELVIKAREKGAVNITGSTHLDNAAMRAAAKALGRIESSVNLLYRIPEVQ
jgi:GNAT superfamily N-acetyltransferase